MHESVECVRLHLYDVIQIYDTLQSTKVHKLCLTAEPHIHFEHILCTTAAATITAKKKEEEEIAIQANVRRCNETEKAPRMSTRSIFGATCKRLAAGNSK